MSRVAFLVVTLLLFITLIPAGLASSDIYDSEPLRSNKTILDADIYSETTEITYVTDEDGYIREVPAATSQKIGQDAISEPENVSLSPKTPTSTHISGFISVWDTTLISSSSSKAHQVQLPLVAKGTYEFVVNWGDGTRDKIAMYNQAETLHTYAARGKYRINITGIINGWSFNNGGDKLKLLEISNWGPLQLGNSGGAFYGASNMVLTTTDPLNLTGTTNLDRTFMNATSLGSDGYLGTWNTTGVTNMAYMFHLASSFNQNLNRWDVSSVTSMAYMFGGLTSRVEPLMAFNSDISAWDVSSVQNFDGMFTRAPRFNADISGWNTSSATNMANMFYVATSFNQSLNDWDLSHVSSLRSFLLGTSYNHPVDQWNISNVIDMSALFYATPFNQSLANFDTSHVESIAQTFGRTDAFNQPLNDWNVSAVLDMYGLFDHALAFNKPLDQWNTSSLRWSALSRTFNGASAFNQDLSNWDVSGVTIMTEMLIGTNISPSNYDKLLIGWSMQALQSDVLFDASDLHYTKQGAQARQLIIDTYNWVIDDLGIIEFTSPEVSHPADITYELGSTGNVIQWTIGDEYPDTYQIIMDGDIVQDDTWTNTTILLDVDGLQIGTYTITIVVFDQFDNSATDTVLVTVVAVPDDSTTDPTEEDPSLNLVDLNDLYVLAASIVVISLLMLRSNRDRN